MDALTAIQNLTAANATPSSTSLKERIFDGIDFAELFAKHGLDTNMDDSSADSDDVIALSPATSVAKIIDFRDRKVAAFEVNGKEMICLPQVYELFLKTMVGGLHTVYTKLRRLEITPLICNVEQVRTLRTLGAIQSGVNRCKLIEAKDFDKLYEDCTSTNTRPGRPSKRGPFDEWNTNNMKKERHSEPIPDGANGGAVFNQILPQLNTQQILMQHLVALAAAQQTHQNTVPTQKTTFEISPEEGEGGSGSAGTPLNLSKGASGSESGSVTSDSLRIKEDGSPNNSVGGSNSNSMSGSSNKSPDEELIRKIVALIDMANEQFKHEREHLWRERNEMQFVQSSFRQILEEERSLRDRLNAESRKSHHFQRAYNWTRKQLLSTRAQLRRRAEEKQIEEAI